MPREVALFSTILFVVWLFARDRKVRPMTSGALWIPLLWITIVGTRSVSFWFGMEIQDDSPEGYLEGSPLDRAVFSILILLGLLVLSRRKLSWGNIIASNRWFFAFFFYCALSILWSEYPFVSFKRWTKELGNVVVILILLTERDQIQALRAVLSRFTYVVIPISVLLIKYYSELGRTYNRWTGEPAFTGITTNKNELGCALFVGGLFLVWDLMESRAFSSGRSDKVDMMVQGVLILMLAWLLIIVQSSTALVSLVFGASILLFIHTPAAQRHVRHLGLYTIVAACLFFLLYFFPALTEMIVEAVGRDMTFTGRTDLWADLINVPINPVLGTGYKSFWLGPRVEPIWNKYYFHPNQAHNGYLETYLNGGWIAVLLLIAVIISTGTKLKKTLLLGGHYASLSFSYFVIALFYNWTEAMIGGPSLIWLILLIATLSYHRSSVLEIERVKGYPYGTTSKYQAKLQYYSPPKEAKQKTRRVMGS